MNKWVKRKNLKRISSRKKEILSSLFNVYNKDAVALLKSIPRNTVNLFLTDIPYEKVNKRSNGIRVLDKGNANVITFNL